MYTPVSTTRSTVQSYHRSSHRARHAAPADTSVVAFSFFTAAFSCVAAFSFFTAAFSFFAAACLATRFDRGGEGTSRETFAGNLLVRERVFMSLARGQVTVLLDGQGGDELFCGECKSKAEAGTFKDAVSMMIKVSTLWPHRLVNG